MKIASVIVTYNRLELLRRTISALRKQSRKLDSIIVVDNGCTDGTHEWLDGETDLYTIHQDNVGGSGGFWRGIKEAYYQGFDYIWCMDDDVYPEPDCLELLLSKDSQEVGILCPLRKQNGRIFLSEVKQFNLSNPFKSLHDNKLRRNEIQNNECIDIEGIAFEGPLIKNEVVEKIGLPNKELFLLYDDSDYSYRTVISGYKVRFVTNAILNKELFFANDDIVTKRKKGKWKLYYHIRNTVYFNKKYGKNWLVRNIRPLGVLIKYECFVLRNIFVNDKYTWKDCSVFLTAYIDGVKNKLGKREQ